MIKFGAPTLERKGFLKKAGEVKIHSVNLKDFEYNERPGYLYAVSRAISSRVNANYDGWPVDELKKAYKTFVGRPVFVEHNNSDPKDARGVVLDSLYRESKLASGHTDGSVYCLMEIDAHTFPKLGQAIMSGQIPGVSMGADVGFTVCSACGNNAKTERDYCEHLPYMKGMRLDIYKNGSRKEALVWENCHSPNFFELSCVFDPADESAWFLDKKMVPYA